MTVLVVVAGERTAGVPIDAVDEVQAAVRLTPLPGAPAAVEGVVDVRGDVVPVLDGRHRFGVAARAIRPSDRLVFLRTDDRRLALRVDGVLDVVGVDPADLSAAATAAPDALRTVGLGRLADGLLVIHDADTFLSATEWTDVEAALARLDERVES